MNEQLIEQIVQRIGRSMKPPRDPKRIEPILELLREVWTAQPDLRLGQILVIAMKLGEPVPRVFYCEDDVVERGLRGMLPVANPVIVAEPDHGP